ncbi:DUF1989 domain-containing protein [Roseateles sp. NT4]|uniref:DUF1989 domain-containing protein n=1 Tax=Roseateles sp. NT4 TaxID=3453715 RepID=UPI003EED7D29
MILQLPKGGCRLDLRQTVPAAGALALRLKHGERLRIIDAEGGQTGDLLVYSVDGAERLSNGRTFDIGGNIFLSTGDVLWSDRSNPMLTIVSDEVGRHDFLYAPCSLEMYRMSKGGMDYHPNYHDNLSNALRELGIDPQFLPTAFNVFMNAEVNEVGRLKISPSKSRAGASIVLRAEMDLAVAISACPATSCNGGGPPRTLDVEVLSPL